MGVMVNEPRGHYPTIGVDSVSGGLTEFAHPHDFAICYRHVRVE